MVNEDLPEIEAMITDRITRATSWVTHSLSSRLRFFPLPVTVGSAIMLGFERNLIEEQLTEPEGLMLLSSSVAAATDILLPFFYAPHNGLDSGRMRALTEIVMKGGKHDFARQRPLHYLLMEQAWDKAATAIIEWLMKRGTDLHDALELGERLRIGPTSGMA